MPPLSAGCKQASGVSFSAGPPAALGCSGHCGVCPHPAQSSCVLSEKSQLWIRLSAQRGFECFLKGCAGPWERLREGRGLQDELSPDWVLPGCPHHHLNLDSTFQFVFLEWTQSFRVLLGQRGLCKRGVVLATISGVISRLRCPRWCWREWEDLQTSCTDLGPCGVADMLGLLSTPPSGSRGAVNTPCLGLPLH